MACPYFSPDQMRGGSAMLPLGEVWSGTCCAIPEETWRPDDAALRHACNLGYAGRICSRFPASDGPDAVRFTVSSDDGVALRIYYVVERDHHPFAHGPLECTLASGEWNPAPQGDLLARQAQAYVESYLRRKRER
jgi:hypothetical protein